MIELNQVCKRYSGETPVLHQVNFSLKRGEIVFLTGHSGAGKSTILKLIALLEKPTSGEVIVDGVVLGKLKKNQIAKYRSQLGIVFQSPRLLKDRSVFDNVALPLHVQNVTPRALNTRVRASLDMVGLLNKEKIQALHLSGGEQQRVEIARAIVHKPKLLLADEPTGNLDPALSLEMMNLFEQFNQAGLSILLATHDLPMIAGMKHRICALKGGRFDAPY